MSIPDYPVHLTYSPKPPESPIEAMFAKAWYDLMCLDGSHVLATVPLASFLNPPEVQPRQFLNYPRVDCMFLQEQIGPYRVDFLLGRYAIDYGIEGGEALRRLPLIVVECDGHDFHERTKEQAQRDKARDRELLMMGYRVLRFTGSEIYKDAIRCAVEVDALFNCLLSPRVVNAAASRPIE